MFLLLSRMCAPQDEFLDMMARMGASSASNWYAGWLQATATSDKDFACKARIKGFDRKQQPALSENTLTNAGSDNALAPGFPTPDHVQVGWFVTKLGHEWILDEKMFKKEWKKLQLNAEATRRFEDAVDKVRNAGVDNDKAMKLAREAVAAATRRAAAAAAAAPTTSTMSWRAAAKTATRFVVMWCVRIMSLHSVE